jgi:4a-hydroxytetrahydrobiopterin dehydratase
MLFETVDSCFLFHKNSLLGKKLNKSSTSIPCSEENMPSPQINPNELASQKCVPCKGGVEKISPKEASALLNALTGWRLTKEGRIRKDWEMKDFKAIMSFFNRVAELAEAEGHHPDLHLEGYCNAWIELWTHAIGGLSENDFIMAAKIDQVL